MMLYLASLVSLEPLNFTEQTWIGCPSYRQQSRVFLENFYLVDAPITMMP